ncbi:hypothetical protein BD626DRAFT_487573 [Schizophyllum amplum]|uniref:Zn(2)-C6 fungal-type domain-containing protein n=1 Tax=Schizophyllum amplum TaxID=97359 RepID=A0A550CNH9_9AGAR|nr:hypothetical protein BD626DRAFT_487573 [Auriculariopsis ampla]
MSSAIPSKAKSCYNCRRRKVKCDGARPICGHCLKTPTGRDDCQYLEDGPSQADMLEAQVAALEDRLAKLQGPGEPITLFNPHQRRAQQPSLPPSSREARAATVVDEPPQQTARALLNAFAVHSSQIGFFMDRQRFLGRFSSPMGHHDRPAPSLLHAVNLWGSRFSHGGVDGYREQQFLVAALHHLPKDLAKSHPLYLLDIIQAEILVSFYFLELGKSVDGLYHSNTAISLCLGARLNLVHSPDPNAAPPTEPALDAERVRAFWNCLILDNYWCIAHGSASALESIKIDTPWPEEAPIARYSRDTVTDWLKGSSAGGTSLLSLNAKAAILMQRTTTMMARNRLDPNARPSPAVAAELTALDGALQATRSQLFHLDRYRRDMQVVISDALICASLTRLHISYVNSSPVSRTKCVAAVDAVANTARGLRPHDVAWVSPIMATLWTVVAEVSLLLPDTNQGSLMGRSGAKAVLSAMVAYASTADGVMVSHHHHLKSSVST